MLQNGLFSQVKTLPPDMAERLRIKAFDHLKNVSRARMTRHRRREGWFASWPV